MKIMPSLAVTNKHLSNASKRREAARLTVTTSSAIEGIRIHSMDKKAAGRKLAGAAKSASKTKLADVTSARRARSA